MLKFCKVILILISFSCINSSYATDMRKVVVGVGDIVLDDNVKEIPGFLLQDDALSNSTTESSLQISLKNITPLIQRNLSNSFPDINFVGIPDNNDYKLFAKYHFESDVSSDESGIANIGNLPIDFYLLGEVTSFTTGHKKSLIPNTEQYSDIFYINATVNYHVVRKEDNYIVAQFVSLAQSGDAKILNNEDSLSYDLDSLVDEAQKSLLNSVNEQISLLIIDGKLSSSMLLNE